MHDGWHKKSREFPLRKTQFLNWEIKRETRDKIFKEHGHFGVNISQLSKKKQRERETMWIDFSVRWVRTMHICPNQSEYSDWNWLLWWKRFTLFVWFALLVACNLFVFFYGNGNSSAYSVSKTKRESTSDSYSFAKSIICATFLIIQFDFGRQKTTACLLAIIPCGKEDTRKCCPCV